MDDRKKLLDEIVDLAVGDKGSVGVLLRKCLVLAHVLKNDRLKAWTESELNGYADENAIPEYRKIIAPAKGLLIGSYGRQIPDQPLASAVLEPKDRRYAETVFLKQPLRPAFARPIWHDTCCNEAQAD